ncbi:replication initiation protein [Mitsuokella jalaludinii]|uniref:replication initiation protein n=1 Tax=Mitsuokella jalaludinii TaxID=187979 RepID=UPI003A8FB282
MKKKEIRQVDEHAMVVQSNEIVEANYRLTAAEQKVILNLIAQLDTTREDFEVGRISARSLSDACGFTPKNGYQQLQAVVKKLMNRSIVLQRRDGSGWYASHWVQTCDYRKVEDGDGDCSYIEFEMDRRLCPHFLQLRERFLSSELRNLVQFTHIYSTRFYMIFRNRVKIGHMRYTFDELRKLLELSKGYKKSIDIKNKIIKVAIAEINEKSDIHVDFSYYKQGGRTHVGVDFEFYLKQQEQPKPISKRPTKRGKLSDEQQEMYDRLTNPDRWAITDDVARKLIKNYPLNMLDANLDYAYRYRRGKHSLGGWLMSCIEKDAAGQAKARKAEREAAEKRRHAKATEAADLKAGGIGAKKGAAKKAVEAKYAEDAKQESQSDGKLPDFIAALVKHYKTPEEVPALVAKVLKEYGMTFEDVLAEKTKA